jgi:hypothetical protein
VCVFQMRTCAKLEEITTANNNNNKKVENRQTSTTREREIDRK